MKKIVVMLLALISLVGITGCGKTEGDAVKIIDVKLTDEDYAYVVKKGNTELVNDFNSFLDEIKENGKFNEIVSKYFNSDALTGKKGVNYVDTLNSTNDEKTFIVATNCPFAPFEYIAEDGRMYGIDIEIAQLYAESKGLTLVVKNIDFDAIFTNVESGYADMGMAGITVSEERQKLYDFTNPYYQASQKLIVKGDNTAFDNCKTVEEVENILKSLNGNKIGYQIGTTGELYVNGDADWGFEGFTSVTPTGYKTAQLAIQDIINGQIYGVVVDEAPAASMVKAMNAIN